ncbi:hypothetical protein E2K93_08260 [Thalassotalea sp. HSM 43]|uniref:hypothetical protein n=1 Tax=Thalassotalea sp. HSM 43 TaxID=2552945 RepID=UPI00108220F0|nr:hypothetical protein [Thalassotalea sp. HSM 43]QBY04383.1 hypothetical protein E2K93_08260 [Thalassotalea sp. HSM 43]
MQFIKYASILALIGTLVGCGHGYEGEYQSKAVSSNEFLNAFAGIAGSESIVVGADYIESQGKRTEFDDIFVRESGSKSYLVFKGKESEDVWTIIDEDTLMQGNGLMSIQLVRVE